MVRVMNKFILKAAFYVALLLIPTVWLPYYLDPFNVFHVSDIRNNGVEPNRNYIKMCYILDNPTKFDSLIFGSSRVGSIHGEKIPNERCYNMTYSAGVPKEHLQNIRTLVKNHVPIKRVYVGVDSISYTEDPREHLFQPLRIPYEYLTKDRLTLYKNYLDFSIAKDYLKYNFGLQYDPLFKSRFYSFGWWRDYNLKTTFNWHNAQPSIFNSYLMDECLADISNIKKVCKENSIDLIVFTNPMYKITHKASLDKDYLVFLKRLALITNYYNFSGYNDITMNNKWYCDTSHYNAEVGDMIIDCIVEGKVPNKLYDQGFGYYVNSSNVDSFIELLKKQQV